MKSVKCPNWPDPLGGDIVGCGREFAPDEDEREEGAFDCPHCGIVFSIREVAGHE